MGCSTEGWPATSRLRRMGSSLKAQLPPMLEWLLSGRMDASASSRRMPRCGWFGHLEPVTSSPTNIRLADGTKVRPGDTIHFVGEIISWQDLPDGGNPLSRWGQQAHLCLGATPREREILRAETVTFA